MKKILILIAACFFAVFLSSSAMAADDTNTDAGANAGPTLTFGTLYFSPPFIYSDSAGAYSGFDIEFARAICVKLKVNCQFTQMTLTKLFEELRAGHIDAAIGGLSITEQRKKYFLFTKPYFGSSSSYLSLVKNARANNPLVLKGKTIGVLEGSTFQSYLTETYSSSVKIKHYPDNQSVIAALSAEDVDLVLLDTSSAEYWTSNDSQTLTAVGQPFEDITYFGPGYGIITSEFNFNLINLLCHMINLFI